MGIFLVLLRGWNSPSHQCHCLVFPVRREWLWSHVGGSEGSRVPDKNLGFS